MTRPSWVAVTLAALIFLTSRTATAQDAQTGVVPETNVLSGLAVEMRETARFTDGTGATHGGERRVVVTRVPLSGPLQRADVRAGDSITEVVISGGLQPLSIASIQDLYRAASQCVTSCLIHRSDADLQKVDRQGFVVVGQTDGDWDLQPGGRGFIDKKSGTTYSANGFIIAAATPLPSAPKRSPSGLASTAMPVATVSATVAGIKAGPHAATPRPQATAAGLSSQVALVVENGTIYELSVFISGAVSETFNVAPGAMHTVKLAPGTYEIAATVLNPNFLPFYGSEVFAANTQYVATFSLPAK
jgi:hypothetical protein